MEDCSTCVHTEEWHDGTKACGWCGAYTQPCSTARRQCSAYEAHGLAADNAALRARVEELAKLLCAAHEGNDLRGNRVVELEEVVDSLTLRLGAALGRNVELEQENQRLRGGIKKAISNEQAGCFGDPFGTQARLRSLLEGKVTP